MWHNTSNVTRFKKKYSWTYSTVHPNAEWGQGFRGMTWSTVTAYTVIVITGKCTQEPSQYMYAVFWEHWYCTQWPPFCMCSLQWQHGNCTQWPTHCMCSVCQEHWTHIFTLAMWIIYQFQCWLNGFAKRYSTIFHPTGKQPCGGVVCIELRSLASQGLVNRIGRSVAIAIRLQNLKRDKDYLKLKTKRICTYADTTRLSEKSTCVIVNRLVFIVVHFRLWRVEILFSHQVDLNIICKASNLIHRHSIHLDSKGPFLHTTKKRVYLIE